MSCIWSVQDAGSVSEPPVSTGSEFVEVVVIYTSVKQTLLALRAAGSLARGLSARIHLVAPEVVPFPAPLDQPIIQRGFAERKFRTLAEEAAIETRVDICLCREWETGVLHSLKPRSVVVMGAVKRWWHSRRERRLARVLRKHGHQVVLVESK